MSRTRKYTIDEFINAVKESRSLRQTLQTLNLNATGGNYSLAKLRISKLGLSTEHWNGQGWSKGFANPNGTNHPIEYYLKLDGPYISSYKLKLKLIKNNLLKDECKECGLTKWLEKPISLHLDHISGNSFDNRLENLRILCPNCHSQTPTYCNKNNYVGHGKRKDKVQKNCFMLSKDMCRPCIDNRKTKDVKLKPNICYCGIPISSNANTCRSCIPKKTKIVWPNKEELETLVWEKPRLELAKEFGVSDQAISKRCKSLGIEQPPRGYWTKKFYGKIK